MNTTPWREYREHNHRYRIRATYGWHVIGQQEPYWSVTGETEMMRSGEWREDSGGCIHGQVSKHFPHLAPTIKWHLSSKISGPMHYGANARYWLEMVNGVSKWTNTSNVDPLNAFKSTVVFGALDSDTEVPTLNALKAWCAERLPRLIEAMHKDIDALEERLTMSHRAWDVYLNGKLIDTVFYDRDCDKEYVRRGLVEHDGYDPRIIVKGGK